MAAPARDVSSFVNPRLKFCCKCVLSMAKEKSIDSGSWLRADTQTLPVLRLRAACRIQKNGQDEDVVNNFGAAKAKASRVCHYLGTESGVFIFQINFHSCSNITLLNKCFFFFLQIWYFFLAKLELKTRVWLESLFIFFLQFYDFFSCYFYLLLPEETGT